MRILFVEDDETDAELMLIALRPVGPFRSGRAHDKGSFYDALSEDWDIIISDFSLPDVNAIQILNELKVQGMPIPFVVVSGALGKEVGVAFELLGAAGYLHKSELSALPALVQAVTA